MLLLAGRNRERPAAAGTECRVAAGLCDKPETCDGVTAVCPADARRGLGEECRARVNACDAAEFCTGTAVDG